MEFMGIIFLAVVGGIAFLEFEEKFQLKIPDQEENAPNACREAQEFEMREDYAAARDAYLRAQVFYAQDQDIEGLVEAVVCRALVEVRLGDLEACRAAFAECREIYGAHADQAGVAGSWVFQGDIELELGNLEPAREAYAQAYEIYKQSGDHETLAELALSLAGLEKELANYAAARNYYRKARTIFRDLDEGDKVESVSKELKEIDSLEMAQAQHADEAPRSEWEIKYEQADSELERIYGLAIAAIKANADIPAEAKDEWLEQLRQAQNAWLEFRAADAVAMEYTPGTGYGACSWKRKLTERRIDDLKAQYSLT